MRKDHPQTISDLRGACQDECWRYAKTRLDASECQEYTLFPLPSSSLLYYISMNACICRSFTTTAFKFELYRSGMSVVRENRQLTV